MSLEDEKHAASHDEKISPHHLDAGAQDVEVIQVFNAKYAAAVKAEKLETWSRESITLYFCCFVSFLCACANGFDGSLMTSINAMPYYQNQFNSGTTGSTTGLIFSIYTVGSMVGALSAGPLADRFGRRVGMFVGGCVIILGAIIATTSHVKAQLIAARFILGWGISIMTVAAPAYCVEIAPANWRGRMVGIYNCGWFGGAIPAAAVTFGTVYIDSGMSWRLPLALQCVPACCVLVAVWFIPESPRWLMQNGREEEARAFLIKYHGNRDPNSAMVALELEEFREGIALDASDKRWWDYRPLFMTSSGRWRMLCVLMISVFGQFSGNGLGYFNTVIFANIGVNTVTQQLGYNLLNQALSAVCALTAAAYSDTMPRRPVLIFGTSIAGLCLLVNAVLTELWAKQPHTINAAGDPVYINPNIKIGQAGLAFYFMFNFVFSFAYTPLQGAYPAECLENTARAKGMGLSGIIVSAIGFINSFAGPIALKNIRHRYIFIFVVWDQIEAVIWYFCCVETQGRTLEELAEIFDSPNPVKASKRMAKVAVKKESDGQIVVNAIES